MSDEPLRDEGPLVADAVLLRRFVEKRDEVAFRTLVQRHGPLVLSACRRGAPSSADADDAFQATFIVLAQSAGKIRSQSSLAAWLYGVACRICSRLRRDKVRRATSQLLEPVVTYEDPLNELLARHDELVTDEELAALPEKLRTPLILRYLAGKSNAEVASELRISVANLEGRLKRAKRQLRIRLIRRGVTLAAAVAVLRATRIVRAEMPETLVTRTVELCGDSLAAPSPTGVSEGPLASKLANMEIFAMNATLFSKPLAAACLLGALATLAVGLQAAVSQNSGAGGEDAFQLAAEASGEELTAEDSAAAKLVNGSNEQNPFGDPLPSTQQVAGPDEGNPFFAAEHAGADAADPFNGFDNIMQDADNPFQPPDPFGDSRRSATAAQSQLAGSADESSPAVAAVGAFGIAPRSPAERRIHAVLSSKLPSEGFQFDETQLSDVVQHLQSRFGIPVLLDNHALNDVGIGPDEPVEIMVRDITLRSALRLMLEQLDLCYVVTDEVLLITTAEEADSLLEVRVYSVGNWKIPPEKLVDILYKTVATDTWAENGGGEADVESIEGGLVVLQTFAVHEKIEQLFQLLEHHYRRNPGTASNESADKIPRSRGTRSQRAESSPPQERGGDGLY